MKTLILVGVALLASPVQASSSASQGFPDSWEASDIGTGSTFTVRKEIILPHDATLMQLVTGALFLAGSKNAEGAFVPTPDVHIQPEQPYCNLVLNDRIVVPQVIPGNGSKSFTVTGMQAVNLHGSGNWVFFTLAGGDLIDNIQCTTGYAKDGSDQPEMTYRQLKKAFGRYFSVEPRINPAKD